jgi:acyl homoserine lactone synthase
MIRYIYAEELDTLPQLKHTMFVDRATQFKTRLKWDVSVNATGYEIDEYDTLNPMYVIWQMPDGTHGGSMRLLPTVGQTMVNDHFTHLTKGVRIESALIWECTRFCISPRFEGHEKEIATALLCAGCEIGLEFGLTDSVGVFDARMVRIYRRIGWEPTILGTGGTGADKTSVGLWKVSEEARDRMCLNAGISTETPSAWFEASFPTHIPVQAA